MSKRQPGRNKQARTTPRSAKSTSKNSRVDQTLQREPKGLSSIKALASRCIDDSRYNEAEQLLQQAVKISPSDKDVLVMYAKVHLNTGRYQEAVTVLEPIFEQGLNIPGAHYLASFALHHLHDFEQALTHISKALMLNPYESDYLFHKATTLMSMSRYADAIPLFERLLAQVSDNFVYLNNAGNLYRELGELEKAQQYFSQAMQLTQDNSYPYSNYLTTLHYDPKKSQQDIYKVCLEWEQQFAPKQLPQRPIPKDKSASKCLRIGMISDGFRNHPVGQMIIAPLEKLPSHAFQFVCYSSSSQVDHITRRFQTISDYHIVSHLTDEDLAQRIRDDEIDILFDLAGHNSGTRMRVMAMQPAPILVKWVGGLINTTGLSTIDYLLTDFIESPEGDDRFYTEQLIRMPGDYICYQAPPYTPDINALPAKSNGYITLGCFNNPMKLNPVILEQWALIMRQLPDSRLYLKGRQYASEDLCQRVLDIMGQHDIPPSRIILEGPSKHNELLACYQQVDIALDPWPYSGGLTTCEAFLMGVPVVTMPGPTFAGRHSASHLVNAGMPELVTHSWEEYRARVIELAADLDSLGTIRSHLRSVLLQSPVCDAETFSGHFSDAMRAIWQRYCEGKKPEAVSFTESGEVLFADQTSPMALQHPTLPLDDSSFKWEFEGKVIAIDHGAQLIDVPVIRQMLDLGTLELITFDPASNHLKHPVLQHPSLHYYPNTLLGNGEVATLYACQAAHQSGTLKPAPTQYMTQTRQQQLTVLAELPVGSVSLDKVSGLPSIDWLVLDNLNDAISILENGKSSLINTVFIHVRLSFQPTHERQPNFAEIAYWAARNGFRFYCFHDEQHQYPEALKDQTSPVFQNELVSSNAIFIPETSRLHNMNENQLKKLAFIAESGYGLKGLVFETLSLVSQSEAEKYLKATQKPQKRKIVIQSGIKAGKNTPIEQILEDNTQHFIHICFNNMHVNNLIDMLNNTEAAAGYKHYILIEEHRSIAGYDVNIDNQNRCIYFNMLKDMDVIKQICERQNVYSIFIHGMFFDWQKELVNQVSEKTRTIWVMWGGDLYNPIREHKPLTSTVEKLYAVSTWFDKDFDFFTSNYGEKKRLAFHYLPQQKFTEIDPPEEKQKIIVIGNSGDPSNNHIDIINKILKDDSISDYKLILPFGYNAPKGYSMLVEKAFEVAGKNISYEIVDRNLPPLEYFELLAQAEFFITAHNRQQAGESIIAASYFGCKVFLKFNIEVNGITNESSTKHRFEKFGIEFFDYNRIEDYIKEGLVKIRHSEDYDLTNIRKRIIERSSEPDIISSMQETFNLLANPAN